MTNDLTPFVAEISKLGKEVHDLRMLVACVYAGPAAVHDFPDTWKDALVAAAEGKPYELKPLLPYTAPAAPAKLADAVAIGWYEIFDDGREGMLQWGRPSPEHTKTLVASRSTIGFVYAPPVQAAPAAERGLPDLPKAHTVVKPQSNEPYPLFSARQMVEYRNAAPTQAPVQPSNEQEAENPYKESWREIQSAVRTHFPQIEEPIGLWAVLDLLKSLAAPTQAAPAAQSFDPQPPGWVQCPECLAGFPLADTIKRAEWAAPVAQAVTGGEAVAEIHVGGVPTFGRAAVLNRWLPGAEQLPDGTHRLYAAAPAPAERPAEVPPHEYEAAERATLARLDMLDVFELASAYETLMKRSASVDSKAVEKAITLAALHKAYNLVCTSKTALDAAGSIFNLVNEVGRE